LESEHSISDFVQTSGACCHGQYQHCLHGFVCVGLEDDIKQMGCHCGFKAYHPDGLAQIQVSGAVKISRATNTTQTVGKFIQRLGMNHSSRKAGSKTPSTALNPNIRAWIMDTGIQADHPDL